MAEDFPVICIAPDNPPQDASGAIQTPIVIKPIQERGRSNGIFSMQHRPPVANNDNAISTPREGWTVQPSVTPLQPSVTQPTSPSIQNPTPICTIQPTPQRIQYLTPSQQPNANRLPKGIRLVMNKSISQDGGENIRGIQTNVHRIRPISKVLFDRIPVVNEKRTLNARQNNSIPSTVVHGHQKPTPVPISKELFESIRIGNGMSLLKNNRIQPSVAQRNEQHQPTPQPTPTQSLDPIRVVENRTPGDRQNDCGTTNVTRRTANQQPTQHEASSQLSTSRQVVNETRPPYGRGRYHLIPSIAEKMAYHQQAQEQISKEFSRVVNDERTPDDEQNNRITPTVASRTEDHQPTQQGASSQLSNSRRVVNEKRTPDDEQNNRITPTVASRTEDHQPTQQGASSQLSNSRRVVNEKRTPDDGQNNRITPTVASRTADHQPTQQEASSQLSNSRRIVNEKRTPVDQSSNRGTPTITHKTAYNQQTQHEASSQSSNSRPVVNEKKTPYDRQRNPKLPTIAQRIEYYQQTQPVASTHSSNRVRVNVAEKRQVQERNRATQSNAQLRVNVAEKRQVQERNRHTQCIVLPPTSTRSSKRVQIVMNGKRAPSQDDLFMQNASTTPRQVEQWTEYVHKDHNYILNAQSSTCQTPNPAAPTKVSTPNPKAPTKNSTPTILGSQTVTLEEEEDEDIKTDDLTVLDTEKITGSNSEKLDRFSDNTELISTTADDRNRTKLAVLNKVVFNPAELDDKNSTKMDICDTATMGTSNLIKDNVASGAGDGNERVKSRDTESLSASKDAAAFDIAAMERLNAAHIAMFEREHCNKENTVDMDTESLDLGIKIKEVESDNDEMDTQQNSGFVIEDIGIDPMEVEIKNEDGLNVEQDDIHLSNDGNNQTNNPRLQKMPDGSFRIDYTEVEIKTEDSLNSEQDDICLSNERTSQTNHPRLQTVSDGNLGSVRSPPPPPKPSPQCLTNGERVQEKPAFSRHIEIRYSCKQCNKLFETPDEVSVHVKKAHEAKQMRVEQCRTCHNYIVVHPENDCNQCGACKARREWKEKHRSEETRGGSSDDSKGKKRSIEIGGCSSEVSKEKHRYVGTSEGFPQAQLSTPPVPGLQTGFKCKQCNLVFFEKSLIERHCQIRHPPITCQFCQKIFPNQIARRKHRCKYVGFQIYQCSLCPAKFATHAELVHHRTTVSHAVKPYQCTNCPLSFSYKNTLEKHQAVHMREGGDKALKVHGEKSKMNNLNEDSITKDQSKKQRTSEDQSNKQKTSEDQSNKQKSSEDQSNKQKTSEDQPNKQKTSEDQSNKQKTSEDPSNNQEVKVESDDRATGQASTFITPSNGENQSDRDQDIECEMEYDRNSVLATTVKSDRGLQSSQVLQPSTGTERSDTNDLVLQSSQVLQPSTGTGRLNANDVVLQSPQVLQSSTGKLVTVSFHYECYVCGFMFEENHRLVRHIHRDHPGCKPYPCRHCGKQFPNKGHLENHERIHTGEKPHVCQTCGKAFTTISQLITHSSSHSGLKPNVCETCGKAFARKDHLKKHQKTHEGIRHHCKLCGVSYANKWRLNQHVKQHSEDVTSEKDAAKKEYILRRLGLGKTQFSCQMCHKSFRSNLKLQWHMNTQCRNRDKPYRCKTCGRRFLKKAYLNQHAQLHSDTKMFKCSACQKTFAQLSGLYVHRQERCPYKCPVCAKTFTHKIPFNEHMLTHNQISKARDGTRKHSSQTNGKRKRRQASTTANEDRKRRKNCSQTNLKRTRQAVTNQIKTRQAVTNQIKTRQTSFKSTQNRTMRPTRSETYRDRRTTKTSPTTNCMPKMYDCKECGKLVPVSKEYHCVVKLEKLHECGKCDKVFSVKCIMQSHMLTDH